MWIKDKAVLRLKIRGEEAATHANQNRHGVSSGNSNEVAPNEYDNDDRRASGPRVVEWYKELNGCIISIMLTCMHYAQVHPNPRPAMGNPFVQPPSQQVNRNCQ